jgi:hypothetical protein
MVRRGSGVRVPASALWKGLQNLRIPPARRARRGGGVGVGVGTRGELSRTVAGGDVPKCSLHRVAAPRAGIRTLPSARPSDSAAAKTAAPAEGSHVPLTSGASQISEHAVGRTSYPDGRDGTRPPTSGHGCDATSPAARDREISAPALLTSAGVARPLARALGARPTRACPAHDTRRSLPWGSSTLTRRGQAGRPLLRSRERSRAGRPLVKRERSTTNRSCRADAILPDSPIPTRMGERG